MKADVCRAGPVDVSRSRKSRPALQSHGFGAKTLKKEKESIKVAFFDELLVSYSDSKKLRKRFQCRNRRRLWVAMHQKKIKQNKTKTKKKQKKPHKNQQVSAAKKWVFDTSQRVNKSRSSTFHDMMLLFHKYWDFFLSYQHISNFGIVRMWECVVRSIRDTNDSIS